MAWTPEPDSALLVVDVQRDFCPGGTLPVPEGDAVVAPLNAAAEHFATAGRPVIASRDWHPPRTSHFNTHGGPWPPHCVQGTAGAEFHPALRLPPGALIVSKGMGENEDAYSAFQARDEAGRPLADLLRERGIRHLYVGGLATDYCVKASVLDARRHGFEVTVLEDAIRAVNVQPGDAERALAEMREAGARLKRWAEMQAASAAPAEPAAPSA
ncbi:MAG TPA: nicotinamidase [Chloroflexota bacterium]|nr:nicotinamidase [Chloroflexota bacterium]